MVPQLEYAGDVGIFINQVCHASAHASPQAVPITCLLGASCVTMRRGWLLEPRLSSPEALWFVMQALVIVVVINCIEHGFPYLGRAGQFQITGGTTFSASLTCCERSTARF